MSQNEGDGDEIQVGDVSGTGIAIGRNASASVTTGPTGAELDALFAQLAEGEGKKWCKLIYKNKY